MSSFEGHHGQKEERTSGATARPQSNDAQPSKSGVPEKREISIERSLATMRGGPPKGTGHGCCPRGQNRKVKPSPLSEAAGKGKVEKQRPPDAWIYGTQEEASPSAI